MRPETNLFLRSLIGKEKARLRAEKTRIVSNNCAQSPASLRLPPEDVDKIIQIDRDTKELNSALSELREQAKKQDHLGKSHTLIFTDECPTTSLSPETIEIIRDCLYLRKETAESTFRQFKPFFRDEDAKESAKAHVNSFRRALDEFNAVYPEEK